MSKPIKKKLPFRPNIYPWDKWFNGRGHLLKQGRDYKTTTHYFVIYCYARIRKFKERRKKFGLSPMTVNVTVLSDTEIMIKAIPIGVDGRKRSKALRSKLNGKPIVKKGRKSA